MSNLFGIARRIIQGRYEGIRVEKEILSVPLQIVRVCSSSMFLVGLGNKKELRMKNINAPNNLGSALYKSQPKPD